MFDADLRVLAQVTMLSVNLHEPAAYLNQHPERKLKILFGTIQVNVYLQSKWVDLQHLELP